MQLRNSANHYYPVYDLEHVDSRKLLSEENVWWKKGDVRLLRSYYWGRTSSQHAAYVLIRGELYGVRQESFSGQSRTTGKLFVLMEETPAVFDISDVVAPDLVLKDRVEVTPEVWQAIATRAEAAWQSLLDYWVTALRKAPHEWNLSKLMRHLRPASLGAKARHSGCLSGAICRAAGIKPGTDQSNAVIALLAQDYILLPVWLYTDEVTCHVCMPNDYGQRRWYEVPHMEHTPWTNERLPVPLDRGPLVIVTSFSAAAVQKECEALYNKGTYGSIIVLIGEGQAVQQQAQRLSDSLLGVDILPM